MAERVFNQIKEGSTGRKTKWNGQVRSAPHLKVGWLREVRQNNFFGQEQGIAIPGFKPNG